MAIPVLNDQQVKDLKRALDKATNQNLIPMIYKNERRLPTYDVPQATFRNFKMSVDSAGTGVIVGEGWYQQEGNSGNREIVHVNQYHISADSMPPSDGKV